MLGLNKSIGNYGKARLKLISLQMCQPLFDDRKRKEFELIFNFFTSRKSLGKLIGLKVDESKDIWNINRKWKRKSPIDVLQFSKQFFQ